MNGIPFRAAFFDLDGTVLDSMGVWLRVDEIFFGKRGLAVPEDFSNALAGKSYRESAEYTIERFGLSEPWEDIVREWSELAEREYAEHVRLKPYAREYIAALRNAGVLTAVTTALPPNLYEPCLRNNGILGMFDELCSTQHSGERGKESGAVYLLAADKLGVEPCECAVFEDIYEGIVGAKSVGMYAYCVFDDISTHRLDDVRTLADGLIYDFRDMNAHHAKLI